MAQKLHPKTAWLTPSQAVELTGRSRQFVYQLMMKRGPNGRLLVRSKENPLRRGQGTRLLNREDIEKKILHFN